MGSGSPGTGSGFSGSGFEVIGQRSGGIGSHLEDSASLWCWSCGITLSFQTENQRTWLLLVLATKTGPRSITHGIGRDARFVVNGSLLRGCQPEPASRPAPRQ